jgi:UDP-N-acetylmuramoyl-L-alanyl-D-glutamate--2,6-diaminopimelate ligase
MAVKKLLEKFIPRFLLSFYHYSLAFKGAFLHGFPSRKLIVIGVTGTKGKSTTAILAGKILEEAGYKVAWFTSATIKIGDEEQLNPYHMTMPGRFVIQGFLKKAVRAGCNYAILEVTSEGIKQYRHKFINFKTAVFTNLKPEHIEAHGSFENYRLCKGKLFETAKEVHILNIDDENVGYFLQFPAKRKIEYTLKNPKSPASVPKGTPATAGRQTVCGEVVQQSADGVKFRIDNAEFGLKLLGEFNVYNALAAVCVGLSEGVSLDICKKALEKISLIPGRMEVIAEKPFKVIIDLAHTPDSFEEVFKSVKKMPHNKIISVFGSAGGGRDKWKRPVLGKIAAENSDIIILTNEDPYNEPPLKIMEEIASGIKIQHPALHPHTKVSTETSGVGASTQHLILDRREAIRKGLELAKENDIVLILGKGTEQLMMVGDKKIKWDDREVVKEELKNAKV